MVRTNRSFWAALVLAGGLLVPAPASAGPCGEAELHGKVDKAHCPRSSYCRLHYWAPWLYRAKACLCGPTMNIQPVDRYPEIPVRSQVIPFPCPVGRATSYIELIGA